jgi:hypothetical protein
VTLSFKMLIINLLWHRSCLETSTANSSVIGGTTTSQPRIRTATNKTKISIIVVWPRRLQHSKRYKAYERYVDREGMLIFGIPVTRAIKHGDACGRRWPIGGRGDPRYAGSKGTTTSQTSDSHRMPAEIMIIVSGQHTRPSH